MLRNIDFSNCDKHDYTFDNNFNIVKYFDYEMIMPKNNPSYILYSDLIVKMTQKYDIERNKILELYNNDEEVKKRSKKNKNIIKEKVITVKMKNSTRMIYDIEKYKEILKDFPIEKAFKKIKFKKIKSNGRSYTAEMDFIHSDLFEILLHWKNPIDYVLYLYWLNNGKSLIEDNIDMRQFISNEITDEIYKANYLGITCICKDNFIFSDNILNDFSIMINSKREISHYDGDFDKMLGLIMIKYVIENIMNEKLTTRYKVTEQNRKHLITLGVNKVLTVDNEIPMINPKLIYFLLNYLNFIEFRKYLNNFYKDREELNELIEMNDLEMTYTINLNNSITRRCKNKRFAFANHGDIEVKFDIETSYIHAKTTGNLINVDKSNAIYTFFQNNDTKEFISELEKQITKSDSKNIKSHYNLNNVEIENRGYYLHPDLFLFYVIWLDKRFAIKYMKLLNIIFQRNYLENKKIDDILREEMNKLRETIKRKNEQLLEYEELFKVQENTINEQENTIVEQMQTIENLNKTILKLNVLKGSFKVSMLSENEIILQQEKYKLLQDKRTLLLKETITDDECLKRIKSAVKYYNPPFIRQICNNRYKIFDVDKTLEFIDMILDDKYVLETVLDDKFYIEYKNIKENNDLMINGKKFEYVCAYTKCAILWKNIPYFYLNKFNLDNRDIGVDLMDPKCKILYQCKHYTSKTLTMNDLLTFERTVNIFKTIDSEWKGIILLSNESKEVDDSVKNNYEIEIVDLENESLNIIVNNM